MTHVSQKYQLQIKGLMWQLLLFSTRQYQQLELTQVQTLDLMVWTQLA